LGASLPAFAQFRRALRRPELAQRDALLQIVRRNASTAYGQAHGFQTIRNHVDFAQRVPVVDYEGLEPWIGRIGRGEPNVLTADRVTHLIPTSGTSAGRKLIPFTAALQREFNQAIAPWIFDLYRRHPTASLGAAYWSVTPVVRFPDAGPSAVPVGFEEDSSYLGGARKRLVSAVMAVPPEVRFIEDPDVFRYVTLLFLLRRSDLCLISVWHPSFLLLLLAALQPHCSDLLRDIREGTCLYVASLLPTLSRPLNRLPNLIGPANSSESASNIPA
jgi:hypothetical protein